MGIRRQRTSMAMGHQLLEPTKATYLDCPALRRWLLQVKLVPSCPKFSGLTGATALVAATQVRWPTDVRSWYLLKLL
jgi:hypothetical protein